MDKTIKSGGHICPRCFGNIIEVDYSIGSKKQLIRCSECNHNVYFRVFKTKVKFGWHANDNKHLSKDGE